MQVNNIPHIGVLGSTGRMGQAVLAALEKHPVCQSGLAGTRHNEMAVFEKSDVIIDFTLPEALPVHLDMGLRHKKPLVIGTTGLEPRHHDLLSAAAQHIALVVSANMSVGIALLASLVQKTAGVLGEGFDIEIADFHHRHKKDAPSGTSLMLGQAAAQGRGEAFASHQAATLRQGIREKGSIGFASRRGGAVTGDHSICFAGDEEIIEFSHRALSRNVYAMGALRAAEWVVRQKPGLYSMENVIVNSLVE